MAGGNVAADPRLPLPDWPLTVWDRRGKTWSWRQNRQSRGGIHLRSDAGDWRNRYRLCGGGQLELLANFHLGGDHIGVERFQGLQLHLVAQGNVAERVATLAVVLAFMAIVICGLYIAWNARDRFGMVLGTGITFMIGLQAFIDRKSV